MDLSQYEVWYYIVQFGIIFMTILLANTIRRKVGFIRNSLLPTSVLAGIVIFILKFVPWVMDFIDQSFMEVITYHCLGLGFIALALKTEKKDKKQNKMVIVDTGITTVNGYLIQAIAGLG
jgi:ESS family glutamate:Na+ symporter